MHFKQGIHYKASPLLIFFFILLTNIPVPLTIDEFTPSLPAMAKYLGITSSNVELSVSVYLIATGLSSLLLGTLSDYYGRRRLILIVTPLYFIGTLLCIYSHSLPILLLGRVLQGFGVGGFAVGGPGMMSDCFEGKVLQKVSSYYSTVYSLIPITAPVIGGYIQSYFDWQANFIFLGLVCFLIYVFMCFKMPETRNLKGREKLHLKLALSHYISALKNGSFILCVLSLTFTWATIPVFSTMGPFLLERDLHFTPKDYGSLALLIGLGFFMGNVINGKLLKYISSSSIKIAGFSILIVMAFLLVLFPLLQIFSAYTIMIPVFVLMFGAGLAFPLLYAGSISALEDQGGVAGALITFIALAGGFIVTGCISALKLDSMLSFGYSLLVLSILAALTSGLRALKS